MWRAGLLVLVLGGSVRADEVERFHDEYEPHWTRLVGHLWRNVSAAGTTTQHDDAGRPTETTTFTILADESVLLRRATRTPTNGRPATESLTLVTPDQAVQYERRADRPEWRQTHAVVPWRADRHPGLYYLMLAGESGYYAVYGPDIGRGPNAYFRPAMSVVERESFGVTRSAGGAITEARHRASRRESHVWMTRLRAADGLVESVEEHGLADGSRQVIETTYTPSADGGLPFPARIRGRRLAVDGVETPSFEVRYTEYRRHTPSAAELELSQLIGETPSDPGPRQALPPQGTYLPTPEVVDRAADRPVRGPQFQPMSVRERYLRAAGLGAFMLIAALVAVWWRR